MRQQQVQFAHRFIGTVLHLFIIRNQVRIKVTKEKDKIGTRGK